MKFSIVIPLYACSQSIAELTKRLVATLDSITDDYEILFINDKSPENDWEKVSEIAKENKKIKGISLSRNFGQHNAITAGLTFAKGEWIVVMDGDLQDQPEEIINLYKKAEEGYDIVFAQRKERQDGFLKRMSSMIFYKFFSYLTETEQDASIGNYGIYNKKVIESVLEMKDYIRYFPTMTQWVGFKKTNLEVQHAARKDGRSAYSLASLLKLALNNIIAFSDKPLRLVVKFGVMIILISVIMGVFYLYKYFNNDITEAGYTSIILSIWFLSGVIIMILGIVGIYVGKTFEKVKERPLFLIKEKLNI